MTASLFLPSIHNGVVEAQTDPADTFADAWMQALGNRAKEMQRDIRLVQAAQLHAIYLDSRTGAELEQNMHVGRYGSAPNDRVLHAQYRLPDYYQRGKNNVECCVRCGDDAVEALRLLLASPAHRVMMMREGWFADHTVWGVGWCGSDWTVLVCPKEG